MLARILKKYKGQHDYWYPDGHKDVVNTGSDVLESQLQEKWKNHIPKGWYGFSLAACPLDWLEIVDEFLDYLLTIDPNFEIYQIKLKFGGLRFYISFRNEDPEIMEFVALQIEKLEWTLFDKKLIF